MKWKNNGVEVISGCGWVKVFYFMITVLIRSPEKVSECWVNVHIWSELDSGWLPAVPTWQMWLMSVQLDLN